MKVTIDIADEFIDAIADAVVQKLNVKQKMYDTAPAGQKWLTHNEAASYIRKTPEVLYKLTSTRQVKYRKKGKSNIYKVEDLDTYLESGAIDTPEEVLKGLILAPRKSIQLIKK